MDWVQFIWQALALIALGGLVIVIILAIIEPGPLEKQRGFGSSRKKRASDSQMDENDEPHSEKRN